MEGGGRMTREMLFNDVMYYEAWCKKNNFPLDVSDLLHGRRY